MYEIHVIEDNYDGIGPIEYEYVSCSMEVLISSTRKLNGSQKTCVCYYVTENTYLTVAGGNEGRFICYMTMDNTMMNLVNKNNSGINSVEIFAAGQSGLFNDRLCVDLSSVIQAASYFFEHHKTDPSLNWEKQT